MKTLLKVALIAAVWFTFLYFCISLEKWGLANSIGMTVLMIRMYVLQKAEWEKEDKHRDKMSDGLRDVLGKVRAMHKTHNSTLTVFRTLKSQIDGILRNAGLKL